MDFLNVIIDNGNVRESDRDDIFPADEEVNLLPPETDIFDLLVMLGAFPSKTQARKNWKHGPIPDGWSEFYVGKLRRHLCIWNPSPWEE